MAPKQTLIWTVLPNGLDGPNRKLSLLVSARLEDSDPAPPAETTLTHYPDLRDWYEKALTFTLRFDPPAGGTPVSVNVNAPAAPPERKPLWNAMFTDATTVRLYAFNDYAKLGPPTSYPLTALLSTIRGIYGPIASDPAAATEFPADTALLQAGLQQIAFGYHLGQEPDPAVRAKKLGELLTSDTAKHFWALKDFLRPRNKLNDVSNAATGLKTKEYAKAFPPWPLQLAPPKPDFHDALTLLGNHPRLARLLGLVIDLEIAGAGLPAQGFVSVEQVGASPNWQIPATLGTPQTQYGADFFAAPKTAEISGRLLNLGQPDYSLVELDVEGAAFKLMGLADTLARAGSSKKTADTPQSHSLPALRSGGVAIVRANHAAKVFAQLQQAATINTAVKTATPGPTPGTQMSAQTTELAAEDLVRGYRVDVKDLASPAAGWLSLCGRQGHYKFGSDLLWPESGETEDEGWASLALTAPPNGSSPEQPNVAGIPGAETFVTESLVRWNGWSLCARRPGSHIGVDDLAASFDAETAATEFGIAIVFGPPSTAGGNYKLPRLRFGRSYQLRARTVDLAGNSLELGEEGPAAAASTQITYRRFEPVVAPTIVLHQPLSDGESLATVAIRSLNTTPLLDSTPTTDHNDRHVAPPLGSQLLAETHGMFDTMNLHDAYTLVTSREGTYADPADTAAKKPTSGAVVHPEDLLALPYLPDPLAFGAAFLGLPHIGAGAFFGLPGAPPNQETTFHPDGTITVTDLNPSEKPPITLINVDFDAKAWPDAKPFRIHIVENDGSGDPKPKFKASTRELTVQLAKAETVHVRLSSYLDLAKLALLTIWNWAQTQPPPQGLTQQQIAQRAKRLKQLATQGRHWLLTPYRELVFVHAVQQPIGGLDLSKLTVTRSFGASYAVLHDQLATHAKSTAKIDMTASWTDTLNDPAAADGTEHRDGAALAFTVHVDYPHVPEQPADNTAQINHPHDFNDTKHRWVSYTATATTRYREFFAGDLAKDPSFPITRSSPPIPALSIPSSVRPDTPEIAYLVPTFKWDRPRPTSAGASSVRHGGGLRVYLENPWYSSGVDELLGVVIADPNAKQVVPAGSEERLKACMSHWGADPIWAASVPHSHLQQSDFTVAGSTSRGGLTLAEIDGYLVAVAAHDVHYDLSRQLWYSDIVINPGTAYAPFVRLALARYQPYSVEVPAFRGAPAKNVHLSRVVLADFAQLAPTRSAQVAFGPPLTVSLAGVGIHSTGVQVSVELQRADLPTDLGWIPLAGATALERVTARPDPTARHWTVTLPPGRPTTPRRLVIKEYEQMPTEPTGTGRGGRLVYAETFPLPA